jgi:hypothetical protein
MLKVWQFSSELIFTVFFIYNCLSNKHNLLIKKRNAKFSANKWWKWSKFVKIGPWARILEKLSWGIGLSSRAAWPKACHSVIETSFTSYANELALQVPEQSCLRTGLRNIIALPTAFLKFSLKISFRWSSTAFLGSRIINLQNDDWKKLGESELKSWGSRCQWLEIRFSGEL